MNIDEITPMIITFNEAANLQRTLDALAWARQIVIIDSYSTDSTLKIAAGFPTVTVFQRKFDHFADQCNFGLKHIKTKWTLSLDADYVTPPNFHDELLNLKGQEVGFHASFRYCILGTALRSTLYPSRIVLYQTNRAQYQRDGHAHRVLVDGAIGKLSSRIDHDDRKPLRVWMLSQLSYARQEAEKISDSEARLGWKDRLRKWLIFAPILTPVYCLFFRGLILDGWPGIFYSFQRAYAELLLSLELLDAKLRQRIFSDDAAESADFAAGK